MQPAAKRIVSLWFPHWPIERLARHNPNAVPHDRAFALVENQANALRITAVNRRAADEGVRPGTALADARACLPELISRPGEPGRDQRSLLKLARWLGRYGPARNRDGPDGIWIDTTGVAHLFGGEVRLLADLLGRLSGFGVTARAGLAGSLGAAYALARFSPQPSFNKSYVIAPPGTESGALAALPIEGLRLDPDTIVLLKRLGLRRIGQLYGIPRAALERRFHDEKTAKSKARHLEAEAGAVLLRLDQALGLKQEPLRPLGRLPALSARRSWGEPLISAEALDAEIAGLVLELAQTLKSQSLGVRQICLTLYRADGTLGYVQAGFSGATCDGVHMMRLLREKLAALDAGFGIDMAVVDGHGAERTTVSQTSLETHAQGARDDAIACLIDRLSNRLGGENIYVFATRSSHIPERAQVRQPAGENNASAMAPIPEALRRPAFLLDPPEPATVLAEVPEGIPKHFTWRRAHHRVIKGEGPERIAPEWWRSIGVAESEKTASTQTRDYFHLEDDSGTRFWMFRQGLYENTGTGAMPRWFVHGLFS